MLSHSVLVIFASSIIGTVFFNKFFIWRHVVHNVMLYDVPFKKIGHGLYAAVPCRNPIRLLRDIIVPSRSGHQVSTLPDFSTKWPYFSLSSYFFLREHKLAHLSFYNRNHRKHLLLYPFFGASHRCLEWILMVTSEEKHTFSTDLKFLSLSLRRNILSEKDYVSFWRVFPQIFNEIWWHFWTLLCRSSKKSVQIKLPN